MTLLGDAHWLKPPTLARHHSNHLHELFYETTTHQKSSGNVKRRHHMSNHLPESFTLPCILAEQGWTTRKDPESEWLLKTTQKLIPSPWNQRLSATWQSSSPGFSYPIALPTGHLSNKISCFFSTHVSLDNSFLGVRQEPNFRPWKESPFVLQYQWIFI